MGILYSHIVFQPPAPATYADEGGCMRFRKARKEEEEEEEGDAERSRDVQYVSAPLVFLKGHRGNTVPGVFFEQSGSYYTILFSHGNGEDLGVTASYALELSNALKTSVLCYDYAGYGLSTGKPSEANCYADIRAAYKYLVTVRRVPPHRVLLFGRSLGSGPTVDLAVSLGRNLGGVVLIAALTSCVRVVFSSAPHTMKFDMFANVDKIERVHVPVFCVHGMDDEVVPFSHGLELSRRARYPVEPLWIRGAGHNNLESSRFQYEVFLRYMKVLHEFRRWTAPDRGDDDDRPVRRVSTKRRESLGALGKVAGCFGPQRARYVEEDAGARSREGGTRGDGRRRMPRSPAHSSGMLFVRRRSKGSHETDLKMLWGEADDEPSMLTRRSSGATFGSRSMFEGRDGRAVSKSGSETSVSSGAQQVPAGV